MVVLRGMKSTSRTCKNQITPRTSQSAGFDFGALIVTTCYAHNVKKFAAPTAPGNCLHSTEHTKRPIWYNETPARIVCANVLYFPNNLHKVKGVRIYAAVKIKRTK